MGYTVSTALATTERCGSQALSRIEAGAPTRITSNILHFAAAFLPADDYTAPFVG
jgi:hypothetical protein